MSPTRPEPSLEYDPALIEDSVTAALEEGCPGIPSLRLARMRLHHERSLDALYRRPPEAREAGFREHYGDLFRRLELDRALPPLLAPYPGFQTRLERILVRRRRDPDTPDAELWEHRQRRGTGEPAYLVITITPSLLPDPVGLRERLEPALRRAYDLLDDSAGRRELERSSAAGCPVCPLCRMPSAAWADARALAETEAAIREDAPDWSRQQGACAHCVERYRLTA